MGRSPAEECSARHDGSAFVSDEVTRYNKVRALVCCLKHGPRDDVEHVGSDVRQIFDLAEFRLNKRHKLSIGNFNRANLGVGS